MPSDLRARVVYKFSCAGCNACYVGQTTRYFDTRVHEHLHKQAQPSSVFKHLAANAQCKEACNTSCFEVIDTDTSSFWLEIKEAIHNEWLKPSINKQKQLLKLSILIWFPITIILAALFLFFSVGSFSCLYIFCFIDVINVVFYIYMSRMHYFIKLELHQYYSQK